MNCKECGGVNNNHFLDCSVWKPNSNEEAKALFVFSGGHVYRWLRFDNDIKWGEYRILNDGTMAEWTQDGGCIPLISIYERIV